MSKKLWIVLIVVSLLAAMIPVTNAEAYNNAPAGVEPYNGLFGADSPLYGLKLFIQHLDLSLEGNVSAKLQKQLALGQQRLSEACTVATRNNTGALNAALTAYTAELEAINVTLDCEALDDLTYLNAGDELQDQEDVLANMTNSTSPAVGELISRTLITAETIKNGRPFIWCSSNNTSTAYFIPPGQMKKLAQGGQYKTPAGLSKKGYSSPEPILVNGTVLWPWDDQYNQYINSTANATATTQSFDYVSKALKKQGNGNGKGNAGGNGKGHNK
jgi:Domain of unknown function (DUF5667)